MSEYVTATEICQILDRPIPSQEQGNIIESPLNNLLIIAGAGSGKTETLVLRIIWLIVNKKISASDILGMTFTKKATSEFKSRIAAYLQLLADSRISSSVEIPDIRTYDSLVGELFDDCQDFRGEEKFYLSDEASIFQVAKQYFSTYQGEIPLITSIDNLTNRFLQLLHLVKSNDLKINQEINSLQTYVDLLSTLPAGKKQQSQLSKELQKVVETIKTKILLLSLIPSFEVFLDGRKKINFELQLAKVNKWLQENPLISHEISNRYKLVLLDEYQDTSKSQKILLRSLFANRPDTVVMAVGDPNQAIYSWRGADIDNMSSFPEDFSSTYKSMDTYQLGISWRNDDKILKVANVISDKIFADSNQAEGNLILQSGHATSGEVNVSLYENQQIELNNLLNGIRTVAGSTAVLVRRNKEVQLVKDFLNSHGIKVKVNTEINFLHSLEVSLILAYLNLLAHPEDNSAIATILLSPRWKISVTDMNLLYARAKHLNSLATKLVKESDAKISTINLSILDAILDLGDSSLISSSGKAILAKLKTEFTTLLTYKKLSLVDLVQAVAKLIFLDVEANLATWPSNTGKEINNFSAATNIKKFIDLAVTYYQQTDASLEDFLEFISIAKEKNTYIPTEIVSTTGENSEVNILTIHAAKGLEWDNVFLPFLQKDLFPTKNKDHNWTSNLNTLPFNKQLFTQEFLDRKELQQVVNEDVSRLAQSRILEEYRLFYVAITRARHNLYLSGAQVDLLNHPQEPSELLTIIYSKANEYSLTVDDWVAGKTLSLEEAEKEVISESIVWPYDYQYAVREELETAASLVGEVNEIKPSMEVDYQALLKDLNSLQLESDLAAQHRDALVKIVHKNTLNYAKNKLANNRVITRLSVNQYVKKQVFPEKPENHIFNLYRPSERIKEFELWLALDRFKEQIDLTISIPDRAARVDIDKNQEIFENSIFSKIPLVALQKKFELIISDQQIYGILPAVFGSKEEYGVVIWTEYLPKDDTKVNYRLLQASYLAVATQKLLDLTMLPKAYIFNINTGKYIVYSPEMLLELESARITARN